MVCRRYMPSLLLQPYIAWYWTLEQNTISEQPATYRLVPDGFVDWVFHLETPWRFAYQEASHSKKELQTHVFGHSTGYIELELDGTPLQVFGIKFQPWAAQLFWKVGMHATTDREISLTDLPLPGVAELIDNIGSAAHTQERIQYAEAFLNQRIKSIDTLRPVIQALSQPECIAKANFNNRRLQQRFRHEIGISPKTYQRTIRINKVIGDLLHRSHKLTDIAYQYGYFDQSHLNRDFQLFTGANPRMFLHSINPSEDFFNFRVG